MGDTLTAPNPLGLKVEGVTPAWTNTSCASAGLLHGSWATITCKTTGFLGVELEGVWKLSGSATYGSGNVRYVCSAKPVATMKMMKVAEAPVVGGTSNLLVAAKKALSAGAGGPGAEKSERASKNADEGSAPKAVEAGAEIVARSLASPASTTK